MAALLALRLISNGWSDIFSIGGGKLDILPLAVAVILLGATFGKIGLRMAAQAVLVGVVFLFLGRAIYTDWGEITSGDWQFSLPWLIASLILMHGLFVCHASGWLLILRRFRHPVPYLPGFYVWSKSLLARYVPGNVLMVVGRVMMIEPYGVPKRISLTSVIYEQALLGAASAIVVAVALPLSDLRSISSLIWLVLVVPPLAVIGLQPAVLGRLGNFALRKTGREPIKEFLPFWTVMGFILYYSLTWVVAGLGLFALVHAVTPQIDFTDLPIVIASVPLAWLLALVVFISPSGLGVREGVYAYTLAFAFNHEAGVASAFAILARFWQTLIEISTVVIVMALAKKFRPSSKTSRARAVVDAAETNVENYTP